MEDINRIFKERRDGIGCPMCPDDHTPDVVAVLPSGQVHLQNDSDYRGYCILICSRHVVEIHELTETERRDWIEDIALIGKAVSEVCAPAKLNVAMLGNQSPHLHCHVIPRYPSDPEWGHPPAFRTPAERTPLSAEAYSELKASLTAALIGP